MWTLLVWDIRCLPKVPSKTAVVVLTLCSLSHTQHMHRPLFEQTKDMLIMFSQYRHAASWKFPPVIINLFYYALLLL